MNFAVRIDWTEQAVVVSPVGEVDVFTAQRLKEVAEVEVEREPRIAVLDLSEVSFIDSTGLGVLVGLRLAAQEWQVGLRLVTSQRTEAILKLSGLMEAFDIHPSRDAALSDVDDTA